MIRPYILAVCDRVILDANNTASLISLFNEIHVKVAAENAEIPGNAVAPKEWAVFTSWEYLPEDIGTGYIETIQVIYPDGTVYKEHQVPFELNENKRLHQVTLNIAGFPIGQEGMYHLKMWLDRNGQRVYEAAPIGIKMQYEPS